MFMTQEINKTTDMMGRAAVLPNSPPQLRFLTIVCAVQRASQPQSLMFQPRTDFETQGSSSIKWHSPQPRDKASNPTEPFKNACRYYAIVPLAKWKYDSFWAAYHGTYRANKRKCIIVDCNHHTFII